MQKLNSDIRSVNGEREYQMPAITRLVQIISSKIERIKGLTHFTQKTTSNNDPTLVL